MGWDCSLILAIPLRLQTSLWWWNLSAKWGEEIKAIICNQPMLPASCNLHECICKDVLALILQSKGRAVYSNKWACTCMHKICVTSWLNPASQSSNGAGEQIWNGMVLWTCLRIRAFAKHAAWSDYGLEWLSVWCHGGTWVQIHLSYEAWRCLMLAKWIVEAHFPIKSLAGQC